MPPPAHLRPGRPAPTPSAQELRQGPGLTPPPSTTASPPDRLQTDRSRHPRPRDDRGLPHGGGHHAVGKSGGAARVPLPRIPPPPASPDQVFLLDYFKFCLILTES